MIGSIELVCSGIIGSSTGYLDLLHLFFSFHHYTLFGFIGFPSMHSSPNAELDVSLHAAYS